MVDSGYCQERAKDQDVMCGWGEFSLAKGVIFIVLCRGPH